MSDRPLVSCVCVTRNRVPLLRRAVSCFLHQTYQPRELVILYETDDADTRAYLDTLSYPSIRPAEIPALPNIQLGSLRNLAIAASHGHYVAQWDDDDWYGPNRLAEQINAIQVSGRAACALSRWIIYDTVRQAAFLSGRRPWEGSLVAVRSALPPYPNLAQGEDTPVISQLLRQNQLIPLESPQLYIYVYHGENTWRRSHWERLFKEAQPSTPDMTELVKSLLGLH